MGKNRILLSSMQGPLINLLYWWSQQDNIWQSSSNSVIIVQAPNAPFCGILCHKTIPLLYSSFASRWNIYEAFSQEFHLKQVCVKGEEISENQTQRNEQRNKCSMTTPGQSLTPAVADQRNPSWRVTLWHCLTIFRET